MKPLAKGDPRVEVSELGGLWRRELLIDIDGTTDTEAEVYWLQGPAAFVDLRQPPNRPDFSTVTCEADLTLIQRQWLMHQAGFAGQLVSGGEFFEWRRKIDLQPPHSSPDAGTLHYEGELLIERGWYERYVEHWRLQGESSAPTWVMHLTSVAGSTAMLIRVGQRFGWARQNAVTHGSPEVEICLGLITPKSPVRSRSKKPADPARRTPSARSERWTIERSSIPYRQGTELSPVFSTTKLTTADVEVTGAPTRLTWTVASTEGEPTA